MNKDFSDDPFYIASLIRLLALENKESIRKIARIAINLKSKYTNEELEEMTGAYNDMKLYELYLRAGSA